MKQLVLPALLAALAGCAGSDLARFEPRPVVSAGHAALGSAREHYEHGKRQLSAGNAGLAVDAFRRATRADPQDVDSLNGLAVAYDRIGRFDLSRRYYEQALGIEPASATVLHNLGYSLALQGRREEGRALIDRALASGDAVVAAKARRNMAALDLAPPPRTFPPAPALIAAATRWIERTTGAIQTLVTAVARPLGAASTIEPRFRHVHRTEEVVLQGLPTLDDAVAAIAQSDEVTIGAVSHRKSSSTKLATNAARAATETSGQENREI